MTKFRVNSTQAVWATWTYEVEADTAEEAKALFQSGRHDGDPVAGPEIGDGIDGYDLIIEVEKE